MNNSRFAIQRVSLNLEEKTDNTRFFQEKEAKLIRILESLRFISATSEWSSLKEEVFDKLPEDLDRQISQEAKKLNPDIQRLNRLSGELKWAERFADLNKLSETFRVELAQIRQQLYGKI